ncbi:zinc finger C2HC domain-containing protein 1C [Trichonephila clavipes]|nr:zinc finger C2HC domain-containing protein 1C [Trichonephila clavipes]
MFYYVEKVWRRHLLKIMPREDASSRNGVNNTSSRSSPERRKTTTRPSNPVAAPSRPRPRAQAAAASTTTRKPASTSNKTASRAASSANNKAGEVPRKPPGPGQEQCTVCGRNFNQDRIEKHRSICKKVTSKKTKVFDATKMRVKGTEAEQFVRKGVPKNEPKQAKKSDWRKKHNDFIEAIRQAKMVQQHLAKGGKVSDLPPPPPSDTSDYVPCPHCGRKFNEGVAERHIPKCKNIVSNKKNPVPSRRNLGTRIIDMVVATPLDPLQNHCFSLFVLTPKKSILCRGRNESLAAVGNSKDRFLRVRENNSPLKQRWLGIYICFRVTLIASTSPTNADFAVSRGRQ